MEEVLTTMQDLTTMETLNGQEQKESIAPVQDFGTIEKEEIKTDQVKKDEYKIDDVASLNLENHLLKLEVQQLKKQQLEIQYKEFIKQYQQEINEVNALIQRIVETYNIPDGYKFEPSKKAFVFQDDNQKPVK